MIEKLVDKLYNEGLVISDTDVVIDIITEIFTQNELKLTEEVLEIFEDLENNTKYLKIIEIAEDIYNVIDLGEDPYPTVQLAIFDIEECECCNVEDIPFSDECCICEEVEEAFENGFDRAIELIEELKAPEWVKECEYYQESQQVAHSIEYIFKILINAGVDYDSAVNIAVSQVDKINE